MNKVEQSNKYIDLIRLKPNEALLFLSLGKDSLVLLDLIYPKFDRIVCVFMYFVKDLEHINRWINWTKAKYPKIEFVQVPHWNLTYILRCGMYCVPNPNVKLLKLAEKVAHMKEVKQQVKENAQKQAENMDAYVMLSFDTYEAKAAFCERFGYGPDMKFIKGEVFSDQIERID